MHVCEYLSHVQASTAESQVALSLEALSVTQKHYPLSPLPWSLLQCPPIALPQQWGQSVPLEEEEGEEEEEECTCRERQGVREEVSSQGHCREGEEQR